MRSFVAFTKKELLEQYRSGKILLLGLLFLFFGIMNPATAKLTPWLMSLFAESLEGSGITITEVTVTALDSWTQFFKNAPMPLIAFVLTESNIFTKEYQSGTLILSLTKGLSRFKVFLSKMLVALALWSACYWFTFLVSYLYTIYYWDNSVAENLGLSVVSGWLYGVFVVALLILFSTLVKSNIGVLCGTGGVVFALTLITLIPKTAKFLPIMLSDGTSLVYGLTDPGEYIPAIIITAILSAVCIIASVPIFNKKQL